MLKICIPIQVKTLKELWVILPKAEKQADLIEIWLDHIKDINTQNIKEIVGKVKKPLIVVCKGKKEKGKWTGTEQDRIEILSQAAALGADFVDVGIHTDEKLLKKIVKAKNKKTKIIVSYHNFAKTPSLKTLKNICEKALHKGAGVVKIATFAQTKVDNYSIFELLTWFSSSHADKKIIALCMAKHGQISRVQGPAFGSFLTFAALQENKKSAPGQLTVAEIKKATLA